MGAEPGRPPRTLADRRAPPAERRARATRSSAAVAGDAGDLRDATRAQREVLERGARICHRHRGQRRGDQCRDPDRWHAAGREHVGRCRRDAAAGAAGQGAAAVVGLPRRRLRGGRAHPCARRAPAGVAQGAVGRPGCGAGNGGRRRPRTGARATGGAESAPSRTSRRRGPSSTKRAPRPTRPPLKSTRREFAPTSSPRRGGREGSRPSRAAGARVRETAGRPARSRSRTTRTFAAAAGLKPRRAQPSGGRRCASVSIGAMRSPTSSTRAIAVRIVQRSERSSGSSSSSHEIGIDTGAPSDARDAVGRDERLVDRVLRVVEPGPAAPRLLLPRRAHDVADDLGDRPRELVDPRSGLVEGRAGCDRDPHLEAAAPARLRVAPYSEVFERGAVQPGQGQELVPRRLVAGVDVDERVCRAVDVGDARRPRVQLDRGVVREPRERGRAVDDQVLLALARVGVDVVPTRDPRRARTSAPPSARTPCGGRRRGNGSGSVAVPRGTGAAPARSTRSSGSTRVWSRERCRRARETALCRGSSTPTRGLGRSTCPWPRARRVLRARPVSAARTRAPAANRHPRASTCVRGARRPRRCRDPR